MTQKICGFALTITCLLLFAFLLNYDTLADQADAVSSQIQDQKVLSHGQRVIDPKLQAVPGYGDIPLYFIPNKGQVDETARFYSRTSRYTLWMTKNGLVFDKSRKKDDTDDSKTGSQRIHPLKNETEMQSADKYERNVSRLVFLKPNDKVKILPGETTGHSVNYFIGNDKSKWKNDIKTSESVLYKDIYKDIDLKVYGIESQIEYDWMVHPGADASQIVFKYENVDSTEIDAGGNLAVHTSFGDLVHKKPLSFQMIDGKRKDVDVKFIRLDDGCYGFQAKEYDAHYTLIIDPLVLTYSTYLGGSNDDLCSGIAVDSAGCAYVTGCTYSTDFPTHNQYQLNQPAADVVVTKLSASGNSLVYSTYLGGNSYDAGADIAVDSSGCAYVVGSTDSINYPTFNQYQLDQNIRDAFVTKLSASGNSLVYSTYLGGNLEDTGQAIIIDSSGCAYVTGQTESTDFPTLNQYQLDQNMHDAFVTKLSASGSSLVYSTYLGGNGWDSGMGIALDSSGCAYVTGQTYSTDFPTLNQYQLYQANDDAFVTKLSPSGSSLVYSTYLGGNNREYGYCIAIDSSGCAYVTGYTDSTDFPTLNQYQGDQPSTDVFVTKLSPAGNSLLYSTYLGGSDYDRAYGIAVNLTGSAYITGVTRSTDFPTQNPYQPAKSIDLDAFVTRLSASGDSLIYSTYLGGNNADVGLNIILDSSGSAYIVGATDSTDFPTQNPYQANYIALFDVFISKLTWQNPNTAPVAVISADRFGGIAPVTITFDGSGSYDPNGAVIGWSWNFGDGETATDMQVTHIYYTPGTYEVTLTVKDNGGLWSNAAQATVMVFESADGLSFIISIDPESIKANGKGSANISATGYQASNINAAPGDMTFIPVNLGIILTLSSGTLDGGMNFDPLTGQYSQNLTSGEPGTATIGVTLDGFSLASANINFTWPQPPVNISVKMDVNRSLFRGEYFPTISWSANPSEIYAPAAYKIYRSTNGGAMELIGTVTASTFTYSDERLPAGNTYSYSVSMVDSEGDESSLSSPVSAL